MINSVIIEGNVVRDPEVRFTPTGTAVCEVSIANTQQFTSDGGGKRESTSFVGLVLWGKTAESFAKWQRKGSRVIVEGELTQQIWVDKTTQTKREKTKVKVMRWHFAGAKHESHQEPVAPATTAASTWDQPPSAAPSLSNFESATPPDESSTIDDDVPF